MFVVHFLEVEGWGTGVRCVEKPLEFRILGLYLAPCYNIIYLCCHFCGNDNFSRVAFTYL